MCSPSLRAPGNAPRILTQRREQEVTVTHLRSCLALWQRSTYEPNTFNYSGPYPPRHAWISAFRNTTTEFQGRAAGDPTVPDAQAAAARFAARYLAALAALEEPAAEGACVSCSVYPKLAALTQPGAEERADPLCCLKLCSIRDTLLREEGFSDCFRTIKAEENQKALLHLPGLLAEHDALSPAERLRAVIEGVFAGNIFDLGAHHTADMFRDGGLDFHFTRAKLQHRPWTVDCFDALASRLAMADVHKLAVMFVDNSGADIVLGMLPLARELLRRGTRVILAANTVPSINDVTAEELSAMMPKVAAVDAIFASALEDGRLRVMPSGNDLPVIDLRNTSPDLAAAAADADLVILEGMGRGIETNLLATFTCEVLCLGMIKHQEVAQALGDSPLFGCVCRYDAPKECRWVEGRKISAFAPVR